MDYEVICDIPKERIKQVLISSAALCPSNGSYMSVRARSINVLFDSPVTRRQFDGVIAPVITRQSYEYATVNVWIIIITRMRRLWRRGYKDITVKGRHYWHDATFMSF